MKTMSAIPGYMTVQEIANEWDMSYSQAASYVSNGELPSIKVGRTYLVPVKEVSKYKRNPRGNPHFTASQNKSKK